MQHVNEEYRPLVSYLTEIMEKLKKQNIMLSQMDIRIHLSDLPEYRNNAVCFRNANTIVFGLGYLKKMAPYGEDVVAATIAHELSHLVYMKKYKFFGASKEEEIFADCYSVILRHRAGYNSKVNFRNKPLNDAINDDTHPQDRIRKLVMERVSCVLDTKNKPITPFRVSIPENVKLEEEKIADCFFPSPAQKIYTDIQISQEIEEKKDLKAEHKRTCQYLLSLKSLNGDVINSLRRLDFDLCAQEQLLMLYQKVEDSEDLRDNAYLMKKFRMAFSQMFAQDEPINSEVFEKAEKVAFKSLENTFSLGSERFCEEAKKSLNVRLRFKNKENRQKLYEMYAKAFVAQHGKDDGSDEYGALLTKELKDLNGKMSNADVVLFAKTLLKELDVDEAHIPILQDFVKRNSFELLSVRAETLISECLINSEQAKMTLEYLSGIKKEPFQFEGVYNKETSKTECSYITKSVLKDIFEDWRDISPSKRAAFFSLMMENVSANDNMDKLNMFVNNTSEEDKVYQKIMHAYINTYEPDQQPHVVATLVSYKEPDKPFGFEDYFKKLLLHSGIDGRRVYDRMYDAQTSDNVWEIYNNSSPLHVENNIIFSHLRKLGSTLVEQSDEKIKQIGQIILAMTKPNVMKYSKGRDL